MYFSFHLTFMHQRLSLKTPTKNTLKFVVNVLNIWNKLKGKESFCKALYIKHKYMFCSFAVAVGILINIWAKKQKCRGKIPPKEKDPGPSHRRLKLHKKTLLKLQPGSSHCCYWCPSLSFIAVCTFLLDPGCHISGHGYYQGLFLLPLAQQVWNHEWREEEKLSGVGELKHLYVDTKAPLEHSRQMVVKVFFLDKQKGICRLWS